MSAKIHFYSCVNIVKSEFCKMIDQRYYRIAGITLRVTSDLPITDSTFCNTLELFRVAGPGADMVSIHHHFGLPDLSSLVLGKEVFRQAPWAIYRQADGWLYLGIAREANDPALHRVVFFNRDYSTAHIYNPREEAFKAGNLPSLTLFPSDQILIAQLLADRQGCYLHSAGAILNGAGMLFVGHSEAGKSTTTRLLMRAGNPGNSKETAVAPRTRRRQPKTIVEILCDDRNIVRREENGWRVYGTWSHGDIPVVSPSSAPLTAICFIEQAHENTLTPITDHKKIFRRLLACIIRPFLTVEWWERTLDLVERMAAEVPCQIMRFDKSGEIVTELEKFIDQTNLRDEFGIL